MGKCSGRCKNVTWASPHFLGDASAFFFGGGGYTSCSPESLYIFYFLSGGNKNFHVTLLKLQDWKKYSIFLKKPSSFDILIYVSSGHTILSREMERFWRR